MTPLALILSVIAGAMLLVSVAAIYITNVTARQNDVPRWVWFLCGGALVIGMVALILWL